MRTTAPRARCAHRWRPVADDWHCETCGEPWWSDEPAEDAGALGSLAPVEDAPRDRLGRPLQRVAA